MRKIKIKKIYFGWWTVIACGISSLLGMGFAGQGFSVFFKPLASELGLNRAVTSIAASLQNVAGTFYGLAGGWASDKYGPRWIIIIGIILVSIGAVLMYFVSSLWSFLLVWGFLVGGGCSLGFTIIMDRAIINWDYFFGNTIDRFNLRVVCSIGYWNGSRAECSTPASCTLFWEKILRVNYGNFHGYTIACGYGRSDVYRMGI